MVPARDCMSQENVIGWREVSVEGGDGQQRGAQRALGVANH